MGADHTFTIDELAQAAGMTPRNVRAYRTKGLLPPPVREGRASRYRTAHLDRLRDIRELRDAGLPLRLIMEAAQRGDDLSSRGPLSRLTATFAPAADPVAAEAVREAGAAHLPTDSPAAELMQRLPGHGVTEPAILALLLRSSRAAEALSTDLGDLLCSDLHADRPQQLPRPLLDDTVKLVTALTQQALTQALLS